MKSAPSFSLRTWRSVCKALSWSTLRRTSRAQTPCPAAPPQATPTPLGPAPPTPRPTVLSTPSSHSLEEFDIPVIQTVIHKFDCIVSWKAGRGRYH